MTAEADIAAYLASKGRGTLPAQGPPVVVGTIFWNDKPSTPDALIAVFGYAGQPPEWTNTNKYDKPSVQVLIRGAKNAAGAARTLAETIYQDLDGLTSITLSGTFYQRIEAAQSGPTPMGKDENGRIEYVLNFYTSKTR
jgi:hypothetical protein